MAADFDWNETKTDGDLVIEPRQATAVYTNPDGDIVIRQQANWDEREDPFVVIPMACASLIANRILCLASEN